MITKSPKVVKKRFYFLFFKTPRLYGLLCGIKNTKSTRNISKKKKRTQSILWASEFLKDRQRMLVVVSGSA